MSGFINSILARGRLLVAKRKRKEEPCYADHVARLTNAIGALVHYHLVHTDEGSKRTYTRLQDRREEWPDVYIVSNPESKAAFAEFANTMKAKHGKAVTELEKLFALEAPPRGNNAKQ